jgi:DeoR/GlpR family transcriptional regulator of sugar metabolism
MAGQSNDNGLSDVLFAVRALGVVTIADLAQLLGWSEMRAERSLDALVQVGTIAKIGSRYRCRTAILSD